MGLEGAEVEGAEVMDAGIVVFDNGKHAAASSLLHLAERRKMRAMSGTGIPLAGLNLDK